MVGPPQARLSGFRLRHCKGEKGKQACWLGPSERLAPGDVISSLQDLVQPARDLAGEVLAEWWQGWRAEGREFERNRARG